MIPAPIPFLSRPSSNPRYYDLQEDLLILRWMIGRDSLSQDLLLIGSPSSLSRRRRLVARFCEILQREQHYVALSNNITESDLKQRREIVDNSVVFRDEKVVQAAVHGGVLVLDGIEKVERNVLPLLNNLLENRELPLDDGRLLMPADVAAVADDRRIVPVHEQFRVVAFCSPVPRYFAGGTIDPPLRSRFQAHHVADELHCESEIGSEAALKTLSLARAMSDHAAAATETSSVPSERSGNVLPSFPSAQAVAYVERMAHFLPTVDDALLRSFLARLFPVDLFNVKSSSSSSLKSVYNVAMDSILSSGDSSAASTSAFAYLRTEDNQVLLKSCTLPLATGNHQTTSVKEDFFYIPYSALESLMSEMLLDFAASRDVLLLGPRGSGRSSVAFELARRLRQPVELMTCLPDISAADFFQRRITDERGNTAWSDSSVTRAACNGSLLIVDGAHRLPPHDLFALLSRLIVDRELDLPDGTKLLSESSIERLLFREFGPESAAQWPSTENGSRDRWLQETYNARRISSAFRVLVIADLVPRTRSAADASKSSSWRIAGASSHNWLSSEIISMFNTHLMPKPSEEDEGRLYGGKAQALARTLRAIDSSMREQKTGVTLSLRNRIRIARRCMGLTGDEESKEIISLTRRQCLYSLSPSSTRAKIDRACSHALGIPETSTMLSMSSGSSKASAGQYTGASPIRDSVEESHETGFVPRVFFTAVPEHLELMEKVWQDVKQDEPVLLIGNQGVGKNLIIDAMLERHGKRRHYLSLHATSTVSSLSMQAQIVDGRLQFVQSPLLQSVQSGSLLVVDEIDKAPSDVVVSLLALLDGGFSMPDGRRLVKRSAAALAGESDIVIHEDFRIILLANRPGFPFHGNAFFRLVGDAFSCHVVENPSAKSESTLLASYAPNADRQLIGALTAAFAELREAHEDGALSYPYSLREAIAIARHIHLYGTAGLLEVIDSTFCLDSYLPDESRLIRATFARHGFISQKQASNTAAILPGHVFPGYSSTASAEGAAEQLKLTLHSENPAELLDPKVGKVDPTNAPHVGGNTWAGGSGGSSTAGLGGVGGPFRLDSGNPVHQVSEARKQEVSDAAQEAARAMGKRAFAERLKEIGLTAYADQTYQRFLLPIANDVAQIRSLLIALENLKGKSDEDDDEKEGGDEDGEEESADEAAKGRGPGKADEDPAAIVVDGERQEGSKGAANVQQFDASPSSKQNRKWQRNLAAGELDEGKLVDAFLGEKQVFKQLKMRPTTGDEDDEESDRPASKWLRFVFDCSGSMYRFESLDGRLQRSLQAATLIMEALDGFDLQQNHFNVSMVLHSGDTRCAPLFEWNRLPKNRGERLKILETMVAHSQYCWSGDNSLEAAQDAIAEVIERCERDDEDRDFDARGVVVIISDANFKRYGITTKRVKEAVSIPVEKRAADLNVQTHAVFLGDLFNHSNELSEALPAGTAHNCFETTALPGVISSILRQALK